MYEKYYNYYDSSSIGLAIISLADNAPVQMAYPNFGAGITVDKDTRIGFSTGYWTKVDNVNYVQVFFEIPVNDGYGNTHSFGFVEASLFRTYKFENSNSTKNKAQSLMNKLLSNNKHILENNLLCARIISICENNNIEISTQIRSDLFKLQGRLQVRNKEIADCSFIDIKKTETTNDFSIYNKDLENFTSSPKIGIAPVVVGIIVYVVVPLLVSAILYLLFFRSKNESDLDIKYSDDLLSNLKKFLQEDVFNQLMEKKEKNAKRISEVSSGNTWIKTIKLIAVGYIGYTVVDKIMTNRSLQK